MTSAKITRCNHYFHGVCLRKWLYVQDRCPFCHEIIMNQEPASSNASTPNGEAPNINNVSDQQEQVENLLADVDENGVEVHEENLDL